MSWAPLSPAGTAEIFSTVTQKQFQLIRRKVLSATVVHQGGVFYNESQSVTQHTKTVLQPALALSEVCQPPTLNAGCCLATSGAASAADFYCPQCDITKGHMSKSASSVTPPVCETLEKPAVSSPSL